MYITRHAFAGMYMVGGKYLREAKRAVAVQRAVFAKLVRGAINISRLQSLCPRQEPRVLTIRRSLQLDRVQ